MAVKVSVRTKLLGIVLPATLALTALAAFSVQARLDDQQRSSINRDSAMGGQAPTRLVHRLQAERLAAATASAADSNAAREDLSEHSAATDAAVETLRSALTPERSEALSAAGGMSTASDLRILASRGQAAADLRAKNRRSTPEEIVERYSTLIATTQGPINRLEIANSESSSQASSRRWLAAATETEARAAAEASSLFTPDLAPKDILLTSAKAQETALSADLLYRTFTDYATLAEARALKAVTSEESRANSAFERVVEGASAKSMGSNATRWTNSVQGRLANLSTLQDTSYDADVVRLSQSSLADRRAALTFAGVALAAIAVILVLGLALSRSITSSLRRLTRSANTISRDQVPALLRSLRDEGVNASAFAFERADTSAGDEFAEVAEALNDLSGTIVEVATKQNESLRRGISDIFVNMARRNQILLDRQIQLIDALESHEEDPDQLDQLFRLDHLATRMRRNAESLLVLAGGEAPRRRAGNVAIADLVRVAVGEVEDFSRMSIGSIEDATAVGPAAVDVAHLLAELMENGSTYSPPQHQVVIEGSAQPDGTYLLSVTDTGLGMDREQLHAANQLLASPPPVGLALGRSLGFIVAGTLAKRHGMTIVLSANGERGVRAELTIPAELVRCATTPVGRGPAADMNDGPGTITVTDAGLSAPDAPVTTGGGWDANGNYVPEGDLSFIDAGFAPTESTPDEPATMEPVTMEPVAFEPVEFESGPNESVTFEPVTFEPMAFEPMAFESGPFEPAPFEPVAVEPEAVEPAAVEEPILDAELPRRPVFRMGPGSGDDTEDFEPDEQITDEQITDEISFDELSFDRPSKLSEALPEGEAFDAGLDLLLGLDPETADTSDADQPEELDTPLDGTDPGRDAWEMTNEIANAAAGVTNPDTTEARTDGLPQRSPGTHGPSGATAPVGLATKDRDASEVRTLLSRYRRGRITGRTVAALNSDTPGTGAGTRPDHHTDSDASSTPSGDL